jgi:hypothetical protein
MDLSVNPVSPLDPVAQATPASVETPVVDGDVASTFPPAGLPAPAQADAATTIVRGGFVERILGETRAAVTAPQADPAGARVDRSVETANLQSFARPHAAMPEPSRTADAVLPLGALSNEHAHGDSAVPAALLVPATLTALHVQHAASWPLPRRGFDPDAEPLHRARARDDGHAAPPPPPEEEPEEPTQQTIRAERDGEHAAADADDVVLADADDGAWREELTRTLQIALAARVAPESLRVAAEQWRRGRCVVIVCPQRNDPAGPGWAFVLWPRKQAAQRPGGAPPALALSGVRVQARLQWSVRPPGAAWSHVRVVKEHHPRSGRQLVPAAPGRVPCEVQLGPVLARPLRGCDVCVRIQAVRRFWSALGTQWSLYVVVTPVPLLGHATDAQEVPC